MAPPTRAPSELPAVIDELTDQLRGHPDVVVTESEPGRWLCWRDPGAPETAPGGGEARLDLALGVFDAHPAFADGLSVSWREDALWVDDDRGGAPQVMDLPVESYGAALRASRAYLGWQRLFCPIDDPWHQVAMVGLQQRLRALFPDDDLAPLRSTPRSAANWALAERLGALEGWDDHGVSLACPKVLVVPLDTPPLSALPAVGALPHLRDSALIVLQPVHEPLTDWRALTERAHDEALAEALVDAAMPVIGDMLDDWSLLRQLMGPGATSYDYTVRLFDLPQADLFEALQAWGFKIHR